MCGIIGYIGNREANAIVLEGIKSLEYRGYDSFGIANKTEQINLIKDVGKIGGINNINLPESNIAIAHTRWATHGGVTKVNAHPHLSMDKKIAVVHNGIIENFQELRYILKQKGISIKSDTDTEVIPLLIEHHVQKGDSIAEAFRKTLQFLKGSFAIVMMTLDNKLYFARRGSPLVLGVGKNEVFLASDVPAFLKHTNKVIYLDDNEYGYINEEYKLFSLNDGKEITKEIKTIEWSIDQAQKGEYPHFMLKEINEQKETVKLAIERDIELILKVANDLKKAKNIFLLGCGTSYHACLSAAYLFSDIANINAHVALASEFGRFKNIIDEDSIIIAVSQSGETADLLDAVNFANINKAKVISIVNVMGSTLTRVSDYSLMMNAGPEICVLSTKSYTSQIALFTLLAYAINGQVEEGKNAINDAIDHIPKLIDDNLVTLKGLATKLKDSKDMFMIGRGILFPTALEAALKVKEVTYIHAEGFAGGELKHGTIALIEQDIPVIVFVHNQRNELILSNAMEIKARGGYIIGFGTEKNEVFDYFIQIPESENLDPILMIIPLQILSYYLALERGCDPDMPRNLAKSVTVK